MSICVSIRGCWFSSRTVDTAMMGGLLFCSQLDNAEPHRPENPVIYTTGCVNDRFRLKPMKCSHCDGVIVGVLEDQD